MKKRILTNFVLLTLLALIIASCGESKFKGYKKTDNGLYYKFYVQNDDTVKPGMGDITVVEMVYGTEDSVIFNSNRIPSPLEIPIDHHFKGDLFEGLEMMSIGDSASFMISADSFFLITARYPDLPPFIDSGSFMVFDIKMVEFLTQAEKFQKDQEILNQKRDSEMTDLNNYIEENNITTKPLESGLYFISEKKGRGGNVKEGEMVSFNMTVGLIDGTKIFSTLDRGEPVEIEYGQKFDTEGLEEGLGLMKKGGKAKLIVPSSIGFGAEQRGQVIPPYSTLVYEVEIINIRSKAEYEKEQAVVRKKRESENERRKNEEGDMIEAYLKDNNISAFPKESGLFFISKELGTGTQAEDGKTVSVHYTGKLLDGTVFDSSIDRGEPFTFVLGQGQVIKGWDEGIALMKKGGKATFIIPSNLAYGSRGAGNTIPPFSPLLFDVELVDVK
ncbi:FKBP-type peptidyl-prolyl cis-trans isomerase [Bacteroidota bacterium]